MGCSRLRVALLQGIKVSCIANPAELPESELVFVMQVAVLLSRLVTNASGPAQQGVVSTNLYPEALVNKMGDVQESYALVQKRLDSVVKALAANGINI